MSDFTVKTKKEMTADQIGKQLNFATALGLTKTAKDAQAAIIEAQNQTFTIRNNWNQPGNKFGTKVKPAKKNDLSADVHSAASWLLPHEEGREKLPFGNFLAVPTDNVRRTKRQIIVRNQRPRNLKNAFIIVTRKKGIPILFQRKGRGKRAELTAMYKLIPRAQIKKHSTFYEPANKAAERMGKNMVDALEQAFKTAK